MKTKFDKYKKVEAHTRYMKKDKNVPGITTITRYLTEVDPISIWANRLGLEGIDMNEYRRELARIGTLWHELIENRLLGRTFDIQDYTARQQSIGNRLLRKFDLWAKDHDIKPLAMEEKLVSISHGFGGTGDFYGLIDGHMCYMDFKSTEAIKLEHHVQAAACSFLWDEYNPNNKIERTYILRCSRNEDMTFDFSLIGNVAKKFDLFLRLLYTHEGVKDIQREETFGMGV